MNFHKPMFAALCVALLAIATPGIASDTNRLQWGSLEESTIVDSYGNSLPADKFTFDLGAFVGGFTPDDSNVSQWATNWRVFDRAKYVFNDLTGMAEFASEYTMYNNTFFNSHNGYEDVGFSRDAYIWVYNQQTAEPGSEWFLARATTWIFPTLSEVCCDNNLSIQWSMGDLEDAGVTPIWGSQFDQEGSGVRSGFNSGADLQTFTFIPEPSSALLVAIAGIMGALRRSRQPKAA